MHPNPPQPLWLVRCADHVRKLRPETDTDTADDIAASLYPQARGIMTPEGAAETEMPLRWPVPD